MKKNIIVLAVVMSHAGAAHAATDLIDTATVISSTPIVERVIEPRQECEAAPAPAQPQAQEPDYTGAVIGGVAGGVLGAQVGRGNGRTAAAAVGAAVGAMIGDSVQKSRRAAQAPAQQCRTVESAREVIKGYTVVYHYNGRDITTTLPYEPGPTVRVGVGIIDNAPAAGAPGASVLGSNVREISRPAPAHDAAPAPASGTTGGYQYRY